MRASGSDTDLRQRLLDLIDSSGVSDHRLSLLATNSPDTVPKHAPRFVTQAGLTRGPLPHPRLPA